VGSVVALFFLIFCIYFPSTKFLELDFVFGSFLYSYLNESGVFILIVYLIGHFTLDLLFIIFFIFYLG